MPKVNLASLISGCASETAPSNSFSDPDWYIKNNHNIWIRQNAIRDIIGRADGLRVLDIGCGDCSISKHIEPLIKELVAVDSSKEMIEVAQANWIGSKVKLTTIVSNIEEDSIPGGPFDIVLAIGLLAYLSNPKALIGQICASLAPGGLAVIQNFNASHPLAALLLKYGEIRRSLGIQSQQWTKIKNDDVKTWATNAGMELVDEFRYALPLPGMRRILRPKMLYAITQAIFGSFSGKRNQWLGFETLMVFRKRA